MSEYDPTTQATNDSQAPISLHDNVSLIVENYLTELKSEPVTDFYELVISTVEVPLLVGVMRHTHQNQTIAARILGINRGTLRKKLLKHDLI